RYPSGSGRWRRIPARHAQGSKSAPSLRLLLFIGVFHPADLRFAVRQVFVRMFGESIDIEKFRLRKVGGKENPIRSRRDILPRFRVFQRVDCDHYSSSSVIMVMWLALISRR